MLLNIGQIGQSGLPVSDVDRAEESNNMDGVNRGCIYFCRADIALAVADLGKRGLSFDHPPHLIAKMDDHDLWMASFSDPDGHTLALMQEAPKGYSPKRVD